ncbi:Tip attachment protein J [uncultured Caudovirales phage]|uniref:Tip attachment protein J n=1 Tax=uncultured Caudovirales phage TaxID=2100421 RepID=A0A6J5LKF8_9CAUD|nr:Tip attachment protein J [uncultured Caudovirales phage]
MPAFAYIGAAVAASATGISIAATLGISAAVLGGIVAVGAAYITSRVINGNANKRNNSAANEGGRIQVPPATNNKIPVVYGSAYVNGIITDARLISLEQKKNDKMFYCIVLSEYTNNLTTPTYGLEAAYWNDLRLTPLNATNNAHIVKDGRKVVEGAIVTAGSFVPASGSTEAKTYVITKLGTTTQAQWNTIAGTVGEIYAIGSIFTCANAGTGTGQAQEEDFIDKNFIVGTNQYVELRVYAGGSSAADQIYPPQSTGNTANAYNFWGSGGTLYPDGDGSWTTGNEMNGLVFAIVSVRYDNTKGFTGLPNMTFKLANNVSNPADVWKDYMTSERYGAGIPAAELDDTARTAWYNFCEEDITYTNVAGETNQATTRYSINGVIDTSNPVKTNIDTIMQNGGAWLSYNVATGLWSPVIKKAVSAGQAGETATYFTASRTGSTLTVTAFPSGRIEAGQRLYNSSDTLIGTITAQTTPTAGETAGQIGTYTTSTSGSIGSTTFYTLPASTLEFSDDNIISGITISSTRLDDLYNSVEVEFYNKYNKDQKAYYRTSLDSADRNPNEPDNQLRMSLDLCNNSMQSDLIGQLELRQSRDDLTIEFTTNQYGIQTQSGDIIAVTSELYNWNPKYFRVMRVKEIETDEGGLIASIQALEYNPDVYTIEPITEFSTSANIGIGVFGASPNLPLPPSVIIAAVDADAPIPNFELQVTVPSTGGPFDEIELYYTEGWDEHGINGKIVPGQVTVTNATGNGTTATLTFATQTFTPYDIGQVVTIAGMSPSGYNGVKTITGATASTISYASTATGFTTGGTITNAAGAGLGLLTVTATTYGNINPGDRIDLPSDIYIVSQITNTVGPKTFSSGGVPASDPSTSRLITLTDVTGLIVGNTLTGTGIENGSFILEINPTGSPANTVRIEDAVTAQAAGTYTVTGGLGTYVVDTSVMASNIGGASVNLFDFPEIDNYKPLKSLVPEGNTGSFTNGEVVRETVTNVPANSATYRRWFVIARMGIKKRFGEFSVAGDVDFEQGRFPYTPNPAGGGGGGLPGVFSSVDINNTTPFLTFSTQADGANPMYGIRGKSTVDDPWFVGGGSTGDDQGYLELATGDNAGLSNSGGQIYVRQYNGASPGTGAPWYGGNGTVVNELTLLDNVGNTYIPNNLTVDAGTLFVDSLNQRIGINNTSPSYELHIDNGSDSVTQFAMTNNERTFILTNAAGTNPGDDLLSFNLGSANRLQFDTINQWFNSGYLGVANSTPTEALDVTGNGKFSGDIAVNGGDITTTQTTFNLINATATTLNIGGASTATNIGAATGTTTIGNDLNVKGTNLVLNSDATSGSADVTILIERGSSGDTYIKYNETTDRFEFNSPITTLNQLGARFSEDLFGTGLHGMSVAGTTGNVNVGGNFTFQRNGGTYPSNNASITVDRAASATDSYITWNESAIKWSISNDVEIENDLTVGDDINLVGDIVQQTSVSTKTITTTAFYSQYSNSLFSPGVFQTIDSWDRTVYRSAKYILNIENTTDATRFQVLECLILGTSTPYITVYGDIFNDGSTIVLATELDTVNTDLVNLRAYALFPPAISGGITRITGQRTLFAKST